MIFEMKKYYKNEYKILFKDLLYSYLTNDVIIVSQITTKSDLELLGLGCFYALDKNDFMLIKKIGMI